MATHTDWPYDADQNDPLTALRIPVTSFSPEWPYLVAFDRDSEQRSTTAEARMIASFTQEYIHHWYRGAYKAKLSERPFDIDSGANGTVLHKYAENDWAYRHNSWTQGYLFWPPSPAIREATHPGPLSLLELMDHTHTIGDQVGERWLKWKAAHPDVFPAHA